MAEQATPEGLKQARDRFRRFNSQQVLADRAQVSRDTVRKFFAQIPISVDRFKAICKELDLNWEEIAGLSQTAPEPTRPESSDSDEIDALVQQIRETIRPHVKERCGTMRVLDMTHPIALTGEQGIYTSVNILEKITGRRRLGLSELFQDFDWEAFDRFGLTRITETRVPGLEAVQRYPRLIVLGKPGAGKTTFLKFLAMQCMAGGFLAECVPLFVTLKDFAEAEGQPDLLEYGDRWIGTSLHPIYTAGRALVLLDGLDEVREEDTDRVLTQIQHLADRFPKNHFVVTCRIAAKEYTSRFEQFTEVEVADFNEEQIKTFVNNWFRCKDADHAEELANTFIEQLETHKPIKELATNPLLLTLLCLEFEETLEFPSNRSELYDRGIRILLSKWDASRRIKRDEVYKKLSLNRKEDLLSQIALITFEQKDYFFKQRAVESYICDYIQNLPDAQTDPEILQLNSETILKSIEGQHGLLVERAKGIYSFSHLTFHEYFAAREIVLSAGTQNLSPLQGLVDHITESRWKEIFLLTTNMTRNADGLLRLIKQKIDSLVATDGQIQELLEWANQKSKSIKTSYKSAAIRAFYIYHARPLALALVFDFDFMRDRINHLLDRVRTKPDRPHTHSNSDGIPIERLRTRFLTLRRYLSNDFDLVRIFEDDFGFAHDYARGLIFARGNIHALSSTLDLDPDLDFFHTLIAERRKRNFPRDIDRDLIRAIVHACALVQAPTHAQAFQRARRLVSDLNRDFTFDPELQQSIEVLNNQFPDPKDNWDTFREWWGINGQEWVAQMQSVMIQYCNIGHDWQFHLKQIRKLGRYFRANQLLMDCLNSDCYVSRSLREEIEETLLLPIAEIERRKKEKA